MGETGFAFHVDAASTLGYTGQVRSQTKLIKPVSAIAVFDLLAPRKLARTVSAFALGFAASQSDVDAQGSTLAAIKDRDVLVCGVDTGLAGFAEQDDRGRWRGFEIDLCHAYAAVFLGDQTKVEFVPLTTADRLDAVIEGQVDILLRNTSWTFARDAGLPVSFAGTYYFDGQGFLVPSDLGVTSARELDGARVCVQPETTTALNLADYSAAYGVSFEPVLVGTPGGGLETYLAGRCDAFTSDVSALAGLRAALEDRDAHAILPDIISKEPLGPVVSNGDQDFAQAVEWVLHALIAAEEFGVTAETVREAAADPRSPEIARLLGQDGATGAALGLDAGFAVRAIAARGHYGEIFQRNLGEDSELGLSRGLNAQWTQGGLMYAPPFR
jgi:general L-amino acid transport system substrate-binding protein